VADIYPSTCIISIVRLIVLRSAINTTDPTWDNVPTSYLSVVELNCGILCASLPTLRPLLRRIIPSLSHTYEQSNVYHNDSAARGKSKNPGSIPLKEVERSVSQEGLKESAAGYYEQSEYANHPGNMSMLTTAIYAGKAAPGPEDDESSDSSKMQRVASQREIRVTREIGMKETKE
jgi:hypothetical protein